MAVRRRVTAHGRVQVEYCRSGPGRADVERVDVAEEEPEGLDDFSVT